MAKKGQYSILLVEDDVLNAEAITHYLADQNCKLTHVDTGEEALALLSADHEAYDVVILDRMMAGMDGLDVLITMKQQKALRRIPVIMQTAKASEEDVRQGVEAGAYYYLTKPYNRSLFTSIVAAALNDATRYVKAQIAPEALAEADSLRDLALEVYDMHDVQQVTYHLAQLYPEPDAVFIAILEFLTNAVEHGNLGVGYEQKGEWIREGILAREVSQLLAMDEHKDKRVKVRFTRDESTIRLEVKDQGSGFDWQKYTKISSDRAKDANGRGVAIASISGFDTVEYIAPGNCVICTKKL